MSQIESFTITIPYRAQERKVWVYLPNGYAEGKDYSVIYMQDGQNLFYDSLADNGVSWRVGEAMDKLYREENIALIIVGVESDNNREEDYSPWNFTVRDEKNNYSVNGKGEKYVDFLATVLKPYVDAHYKTNPKRKYTAVCGSGLGAVTAIAAAIKYNNIFNSVGALSTAGAVLGGKLDTYLKAVKCEKVTNFYLYAGGDEGRNAKESQGYVDCAYNLSNILGKFGNRINLTLCSFGRHDEREWYREFIEFVKFYKRVTAIRKGQKTQDK